MLMFIFIGCILTNILMNTTLSSKNFQKTNILYSGTPKTYTLIITKIDNKKVPIAPRRTQIGDFKFRLQAMIADGTIHTKKTIKNLLDSVIINLVLI